MNVSQKDAQDSLAAVKETMTKTHKAIASGYASDLLIMWGLLWAMAFTATHFYLDHAFYIFMAMGVIGGIGTYIFVHIFRSKVPLKDDSSPKVGWRIWLLWIFLFIYIIIWLSLLAPFNGLQCNAFICTAVMFAYIVIGLWFGSYFMVVLGLAVTAATLVGFFLLTSYYCLWMAPMGGGALLGTGLYIRFRWR